MRKFISAVLVTILFVGCHNDHYVGPQQEGMVTFSLSQIVKDGGRIKETATPAFVLLDLEDSQGNLQGNIKLSLYAFGQSYLSEGLKLQTGQYHLVQFVVLDPSNTVIFATPLEGSPLANYISHPLPLNFTITTEETTQIIPEVLAVTEVDDPEQFGYASFGFEVVDITALRIPSADNENIVKVTWEFSNETQTIVKEGIPTDGILNLNEPALLGKTWQAKIHVWIEAGPCYQKVYRLQESITFDGSVKKLPAFTNESWKPLYYNENSVSRAFYSVDPRGRYHVEMQLLFIPNRGPSVDRGFWTEDGDPLVCPMGNDNFTFENFTQNSDGIWEADFKAVQILDYPAGCETSDESYVIDSGIIGSKIGSNGEEDVFFVQYFNWRVTNGVITPVCPSESSSGRTSGTNNVRPAKLRPR